MLLLMPSYTKIIILNFLWWNFTICFRHYRSGRAACLDNEPINHVTYVDFPTAMPGDSMDGDKQCELQYGPSHKACKTNVSWVSVSLVPLEELMWYVTAVEGFNSTQL